MSTERLTADLSPARRVLTQNSVVGVDGGGTKTEAVVMDANQRVIGEGRAGPSNPLRVGIAGAAAAVREAIDSACAMAKLRRGDIARFGNIEFLYDSEAERYVLEVWPVGIVEPE